MLLIAVTIAKPIVDDAAFREQYASNPQVLSLALAKMARKTADLVREKDPSWVPAEVVLVADPDMPQPYVALQRGLDVAGGLRSLPTYAEAARNPLEALGALLSAYELEEGLEENAKLPLDERLHALIERFLEVSKLGLPDGLKVNGTETGRMQSDVPNHANVPQTDDLAAVDSTILARELRATRQRLVELYDVVTDITAEVCTPESGAYNLMDDQAKVIENAQEHIMQSAANDPLLVLADQLEVAWRSSREGEAHTYADPLVKLLAEIRKGRPKPENGQVLISVSQRSYERLKFLAGASAIDKSVEALLDSSGRSEI